MARVVVRSETDAAGLEEILRPRTDVVLERHAGNGRFEAESGPVLSYERTVDVVRGTVPGQPVLVTQTVDFRLAVPYFGFLFVMNITLGSVTPPVGVLLFVASGIWRVNIVDIIHQVWPFVVVQYAVLFICMLFPQVVLFLPKMVGY